MSPNQYEESGLTEGIVSFRFVETEAEYREVLDLRFKEYSAAGKVAPGKTALDMADEFDQKSKIVIGLHRGEIVASIRMILHEPTGRLEQEQFVEWPTGAPARGQLVEATRACIRHDFRGTDLFLSMLTFFGKEAMKRQKRYVVLCASGEMVGFYCRAGAQAMGLSYAHKDLNGKIHHVYVVDIHKVFLGGGVNPLVWNLTWGKIYADPIYRKGIRITAQDRVRVTVYSLFRSAARNYMRRKLRRKHVPAVSKQRYLDPPRSLVHESA
jgi:predicted GNAT family N-acyltransferase